MGIEEVVNESEPNLESMVLSSKSSSFDIKWQVWQPIPIAFLSAFLSKFYWTEFSSSIIDFDSQWWSENGVILFSGIIYSIFLFVGSLYWLDNWKKRAELFVASVVTTIIAMMLIIGGSILCWPFLIAGWVLITVFWGRYNLSPWRTGVWLGFGGSVVLVLAGVLAHIII